MLPLLLLLTACRSTPKDDTGDTSDTGETGDTSDTGETGDTSDTGETNDSGDTSDTSDSGETGDTGDTGSEDCSDGLVWDGVECVPEACGTEQWGSVPGSGRVLYVLGGAKGGDGTHGAPFGTVSEAIAALDSSGGFVAIGKGVYQEALVIDASRGEVTLSGRCPELVEMNARTAGADVDGVLVTDSPGFAAERMVFTGAGGRGMVLQGSVSTLTDVQIIGALSVGLVVEREGSAVITDSVFDQNHEIGVLVSDTGTVASLSNVAITRTDMDARGVGGIGLSVQTGAVVDGADLIVSDNHERGVQARSRGATLTMERATIRDTQARTDGFYGRGIEAGEGGIVACDSCEISGNAEIGALAEGSGAEVSLTNGELAATVVSAQYTVARGVVASSRGSVMLESMTVTRNEGPGVHVVDGGTADLHNVTLQSNRFAEVVLEGGTLTMGRSRVLDDAADPLLLGGLGIFATGSGTGREMTLDEVTASGHPYASVWIDGRGAYQIGDSDLSGSTGVDPGDGTRIHGNALYASGLPTLWDGSTGLTVTNTTLQGANVGALLSGATGTFTGATWSGNGVDLVQQECDGVEGVTYDVAPAATELCTDAPYATERITWTLTP